MNQFNVLNWDINRNELESYDVLPYFRSCYEECRKKDRPVTADEWKEFVKSRGMYRFWSNAVYEFEVSRWPHSKDRNNDRHIKIDIWQQIEMNLDLIVELLMKEYKNV